MRVILKELLDKLAVGYLMSAYETCPWSVYDEEQGITCNAEVRVGVDGDDLEVEVLFIYDNPPEGKHSLEQMFWVYCKQVTGDKWSPKVLRIKGEDETNFVANWEEKACNFFSACVQEIKMDNLPDIDALLEQAFHSKERFGAKGGSGGSKSPKVKPQQLMGMKGGMGR